MKRVQVSKNFYLDEYFDKDTYKKYEASGELWKLCLKLDTNIVEGVQLLRDKLGVSLTINNWHSGGVREWSGYRPKGTPYYSENSMHSICRAVDIVCSIPAEDVRTFIRTNWNDFKKYFKRTEANTSWVHLDSGFVLDYSKLTYVNP
jgi:hypothetical protein